MDEFYPGSKTRRLVHADPVPDEQEPLELGTPRVYRVGGKNVEFFTMGQLAAALHRKPVTLRRWESEGIIPVPRFTSPGNDGDVRGKRRLYTRAQIEGMVAIATQEGLMDDSNTGIRKTKFTQLVVALFEEEDV
jgi:hypothetical protein